MSFCPLVMAPTGLATMTMATSAAASASSSLLIEPPSEPRTAMAPIQHADPRCPRALSLAQSLEYAHTVWNVSIAAGGTDGTLWTVAPG